MKIGELRNKSENELETRERELVEQLFKLRFQRATGRMENPMKIRQVKRDARDMTTKAGAPAAVVAAEKTLRARLEAVEADMTQMQGEGGQDGLNFPGRMDNQLTTLYGAIIAPERRMGTPVLDRYKDLKPPALALQQRWVAALKTDVAAFNAVATKAGLPAIVVK